MTLAVQGFGALNRAPREMRVPHTDQPRMDLFTTGKRHTQRSEPLRQRGSEQFLQSYLWDYRVPIDLDLDITVVDLLDTIFVQTRSQLAAAASTVHLATEGEPSPLARGDATQDPEVTPYVVTLRRLLENDRITDARELIKALPLRLQDEPAIARLRKALMPPTVRRRRRREIDRGREYAWLRQHSAVHRGRWVAVDGDRLVAEADSLALLMERLRERGQERPPLVHKIE